MPQTTNANNNDYELLTIRFSHYNEKARWALDYFGIAYLEKPYLPVLHMLPVYFTTRKYNAKNKADKISTPLSTPVLVEKKSKTILCDSTDILRYLDTTYSAKTDAKNKSQSQIMTLYPEEHKLAIMELEKRLHDKLGPSTRRMAYFYILASSKLAKEIGWANLGSSFQAMVFSLGFGVVKNKILTGLQATQDRVGASLEIVKKEFDYVGELLIKNGTGFIYGDRFTAADLCFACMAAPILLPQPEEGYGAKLPNYLNVNPVFGKIVEEMRNSVAGKHALRMFREQRPEPKIPCRPILRSRL